MQANSDMAAWLLGLGLPQYEQAFHDNAIDFETLPDLNEGDLEKLGVLLGHRKKMLRAIAALSGAASSGIVPGDRVNPAAPRIEGAERRQLTVMFCDLVASTSLATRLDPEDWREILAGYTARVSQEVGRFGGFVARFLGDGILVYFGYPQAREGDAERALRAGLALVETVGQLQVPDGVLQTRIGIATGLVVVGDLAEGGSGPEHEVVGETPNLAARLQSLAEPNAVVVSASTRNLVGDLFEFRDLGAARLKGFAEPVQVWQVLGTGSVDSRFEALRKSSWTPLVGREHELDLLSLRWRRAKAGEGQIVLLSGEPGIGKSRILAAFEERLRGEPFIRVRFFCSPHHQDSTLYPFIARIERAARFVREDALETRLDKLEALLSQSGEVPPDELALFADLMGLPSEERYPPLPLDPRSKRELTLSAIVRQLESYASTRPVILIFDDIHWIDSTSLELLDVIAGRIPHLPVLLCATFRPEFQPPWTGQAHVTTLALSRLDQRQTARLVARVAGDKPLPPEIMDQIVGRADGIPLFVEELTKALLEGGLLRERDDRYVLDGPLPPVAIPSSLYASLMARLDRLSPVKEVAQIGAAIGREFSYELMAALARRSDEQLRDALQQLVSSGLVFCRGEPPQDSFIFKHALVQDAAYGSLLRRQRQELHARIGRVLEERFPETIASQPEILAHHFTQAGLIDVAIEYWRKAGERALRRSANVEGVRQLQHAMDLLMSLPAGHDRDRREFGLRLVLGPAMRALRGNGAQEVLEIFSRAEELLDASSTLKQQMIVLEGLWSVRNMRGEFAAARTLAEKCVALAAASDDPEAPAMANLLMGHNLWGMGLFSDARTYLERTLDYCAPGKEHRAELRFSFNLGVAGASFLALTLWPLGYLAQAADAAARARKCAHSTGHVPLIALVSYCDAFLSGLLGADPVRAAASADDALAYCVDHGVAAYEPWARFCQGAAVALLSDPRSGIGIMRDAMEAAERARAGLLRPIHLGHLAVATASVGEHEVAVELLDRALQTVADTEERCYQAELHRLRGGILLELGNNRKGEAELERALVIARSQEARLWELRAATSLARLWSDAGRRADACDLLTPVYGWFTAGFDIPDLKDAQAVLTALH
jgi:class 3 adenylate cyclase/tetratricopeptide (TPR) repeat protein